MLESAGEPLVVKLIDFGLSKVSFREARGSPCSSGRGRDLGRGSVLVNEGWEICCLAC